VLVVLENNEGEGRQYRIYGIVLILQVSESSCLFLTL